MQLTVKEMELLCVMHSGSRSATLEMLNGIRGMKKQTPERIAVIDSLIEKLSGMKDGDTVFLSFDPE